MPNSPTLLQKIALGDKHAFQELYNEFSEKVYNTVISFLQSEADAEEVTQDVFVKIHKKASSFKGDSSVGTWVYRIAVNTSLNFLKKRNRFSFFGLGKSEMSALDFENPGVLLENKEKSKILFKAIESLLQRAKKNLRTKLDFFAPHRRK
ncbi:MAG: RNA polymerase sigma factor (sigma-70 family) [Arenicella sp.]|jgi:RNA polymerase sigma factor (sigma-70 family)